jgi:hypothetical protein
MKGARGMVRVRFLAGGLVLACLVGGCSSGSDDKDASAGKASDKSSAVEPTASPGPGADKIDPMVDDNGAPGKPDAKGRQTDVFDRVPGKKSDTCVTVGGDRDVKSGGFVGGPFDDARKSYGKARDGMTRKQVRLYWVPQHSQPMKGLTVTATSGGKTVKVTQRTVADAEQWKFYDTVIALPQAGSWRFKVSSGVDQGCFVASF